MNGKIFIAGGLALLFIVDTVQEDALYKCANFGETCDLNLEDLKHPCCDDSLKCTWLDSATEYQCIKRAILGGNCRTNEDCSYVLHSTCSSETCVCRRNNVQINDTKCMPLLNEFCWKEPCAPDNSVCLDNECQCRTGFLAVGNDRCVENVMLGAPCSNDTACMTIKFATCALNRTCACSEKAVMIEPMLCSLLLKETCVNNNECRIPNSECIDQKCQCKLKYIAASNTECKNAYIGMLCKDSSYCHSNIKNTECVQYKCECPVNFVSKNGSWCLSPLHCNDDSDCERKNFHCIDNECQCKSGYLLREMECLPEFLGGLCETSSDCINIDDAVCKNSECTCKSGFFPIHRSQCGRGLRVNCSSDEDCIINNSQCIDKKCQCSNGYTGSSEKFCLPKFLHGFCSNDDQCQLIPNSHCSKYNQCICRKYAYRSTSVCAPFLTQNCSMTNECIIENSWCIDNECQCRDGYLLESNDKCTLKYQDKSCVVDTDCIDISNAKCSHNNKCVCKPHYIKSEQCSCSLQLEAYCQQDGDCLTKDSICFDKECQCPKEFFQVSDNLCARGFIGQYCSTDKNCDMITNGRCSEENMCACKSGYAKFNSLVCLPLIGEHCNEHKDCYVYNSNCIDNKCQCLENYMPLSNTKCLSKYVDLPCYDDDDCLTMINSHCSRFARCICNINYVVSKQGTCKPALNGRCSDNLRCLITNSQCIDDKCQCQKNFVSGIYNNCIPTRLEEYCVSDKDCAAIKYSQCIKNKCVCKKNYEPVDNTACKPLLNSFCNTNEDCIVEHSNCIYNKCQCSPKTIMQSLRRCEPISEVLGQSCETDLHCSLIEHGICSPDKICVCSLDTLARNNKTCVLLLNTSCQFNECKINFSHCVDNKCQCKPGYTAISSSQCINSNTVDPCEENTDCVEPWHFECSIKKQCICKDNNVAVGNSTCLPLLGGICWRNDQCIATNSYCNDYRCHCKPNFISVAINKCVPKF